MNISVTTDIENDLVTDFKVVDTIVKDDITCYIGQDIKGSVLVKDNYTIIYRKDGEHTKIIGQFDRVEQARSFIRYDLDFNLSETELQLISFRKSMDSIVAMLNREYNEKV